MKTGGGHLQPALGVPLALYVFEIQIIGRAARNVNAKVVLYADTMTDSMKRAIAETKRRRDLQVKFNADHHITPQTIIKPVKEKEVEITDVKHLPRKEIPNVVIELEKQMQDAAEGLDFERAIALRDQIKKLTGRMNEAVARHHGKPKAGAGKQPS